MLAFFPVSFTIQADVANDTMASPKTLAVQIWLGKLALSATMFKSLSQ